MRPHIAIPLTAALSFATSGLGADLPTVDFGYTIQQATSYNDTGSYYSFNNVRFGRAPVGPLRFSAPKYPLTNRTVQTGNDDRICHQAGPAWFAIAAKFLPAYLTGDTRAFYEEQRDKSSTPASGTIQVDPRENEDCLFLDVVVPKKIFDKRVVSCEESGKAGERQHRGAAVLVWIHGGGYVTGSKAGSGNPAGLLARSQDKEGAAQGVVYVAINYRLGAFGWLAGPTLQSNGVANAGLLDQRLALEWVQKNIHVFGGDPKRVTLVGESAGGGSIMHQITAYGGGRGPVPFQRAVPQSAAFVPIPSSFQQENTTNNYLAILNVSSVQAARSLPSTYLASANALLIGLAPYGSFVFSPVVDGDFVPALPGKLLLQGNYHKDVTLMIGHNADEAILFTSPYITSDTAYDDYLALALPVAQPSVLRYISQTLYPSLQTAATSKAILPYKDEVARAAFTSAEAFFTCNTYYLTRAFHNRTYNYVFTVPPAIHGQDVPYTFYGTGSNISASIPLPINQTVAVALQNYITDFAQTGTPNGAGVPKFDMYGPDAQVLSLGINGLKEITDETANERCRWWQKALYI